MEVLGRGCAYIMAKLPHRPLWNDAQKWAVYTVSGLRKCVHYITSFPPVSFLLRLNKKVMDKLRSNRYVMIIVRLLLTVGNMLVKLLRIVLDRQRPILRYSVFLLVSVSLMVHVLGFSTPWWIFIEGHYSDPCNHIQGLWEMCIMTKRGVIDECESSYQLEKEHPPSSFVNSCGERSLRGLRLFSTRVLEALGLVLATLSEILLIQFLLTMPRQRRPPKRTLIPMVLSMLATGTVIIGGVLECKKQVDMSTRPDDSMYLEWSSYVSWSAGVMFIVSSFITLLL